MAFNTTTPSFPAANPLRSYFQQQWLHLLSHHSPADLEFHLSNITMLVSFFLPCTIFALIDLLFPVWSNSKKRQENRWRPNVWEMLDAGWGSTRNTLINGALQYVAVHYGPGVTYDYSPELPGVWTVCWQFVFGSFCREVLNYITHRGLHHPVLYRHFHKPHHRFIAPVAFAALNTSWLDHILVNSLPIMLPYALMKAHAVSFCVFLGAHAFIGALEHTGYDLPGNFRRHDIHHERSNMNYSIFGLMDWMCGTDKMPRKKEMKKS